MTTEYTCAMCRETFNTDPEWTDVNASLEYAEMFPNLPIDQTPVDVVCDDCYKRVMGA